MEQKPRYRVAILITPLVIPMLMNNHIYLAFLNLNDDQQFALALVGTIGILMLMYVLIKIDDDDDQDPPDPPKRGSTTSKVRGPKKSHNRKSLVDRLLSFTVRIVSIWRRFPITPKDKL